jgi:hypothetical protein
MDGVLLSTVDKILLSIAPGSLTSANTRASDRFTVSIAITSSRHVACSLHIDGLLTDDMSLFTLMFPTSDKPRDSASTDDSLDCELVLGYHFGSDSSAGLCDSIDDPNQLSYPFLRICISHLVKFCFGFAMLL